MFERFAELRRAGEPFALATVIARHSPVSSHLGDRALIYADGRMEGFVGGACSRDIVRRQALEAMRTGLARVLEIRSGSENTGSESRAERVVVPMTCVSGGAVEVYIEPFLPPRRLLVAGLTPVADALARAAVALGDDVTRVVAGEERRDVQETSGVRVIALADLETHLAEQRGRAIVAVVASQGHYDEAVLRALSAVETSFVALLASRKRAAGVFGSLVQDGVNPSWLERVHAPAGLDLGARTPGDVAVSILAEIVAAAPARGDVTIVPEVVTDPVCGMEVELANAKHRFEYNGTEFAFCCPHCRRDFERNPERYVTAVRP
jgi:xanthine dehydrogenase accessory factor